MPMAELSRLGKEQMEKIAEAEHACPCALGDRRQKAHCSDFMHINLMGGYGVYVVNLISPI